jgi:hypothetical protein
MPQSDDDDEEEEDFELIRRKPKSSRRRVIEDDDDDDVVVEEENDKPIRRKPKVPRRRVIEDDDDDVMEEDVKPIHWKPKGSSRCVIVEEAVRPEVIRLTPNKNLVRSKLLDCIEKIFGSNVLTDDDNNRFKPREKQVDLLRKYTNASNEGVVRFNTLSNSEWLHIMHHTNQLWHNVSDAVFRDQFNRAYEICEELINSNKTEVVLLDGHGRMVFLILFILSHKGVDIDRYRFHVFELNKVVYDWHTMFFPSSCTHYNTTIFNYRDRTDLITFSSSCVVYLNFCSVSDQLTELMEYIPAAIYTTRTRVFVSWGIRGVSTERNTPFRQFLKNVNKMCQQPHVFSSTSMVSGKYIAKLVSHRNNFVSYAFFA